MAQASTEEYFSTNHLKYTHGNRIYRWHVNAFLERVSEMLAESEPATVLDAGCGEGFALDFLTDRHPDVRFTGMDLSKEAIAYAEAHFGEKATFRTGSIYKLPFSDNSFDTVLCSEVLEHLDEPDRAVEELKRVARRHVLITVPLEPYFQKLNDLGKLLRINPDPGHVNFWTKGSFRHFIDGHFENARCDTKHIFQLALAAV